MIGLKRMMVVAAAAVLASYSATLYFGRRAVARDARDLLIKEFFVDFPQKAAGPRDDLSKIELSLYKNWAVAPGVVFAGYEIRNSESFNERFFLWVGPCTFLIRGRDGAPIGTRYVSKCS